MAAESAALSLAEDRHLYARLLMETLLEGEPDYGPDWRHRLKMPGIMVTEAKSLYDHLNATGSIPKERQTLIDLLVVRDLIDNNALKLLWVPTTHMMADVLTKSMKLTDVMHKFYHQGRFSLVKNQEEADGEEHRRENRP